MGFPVFSTGDLYLEDNGVKLLIELDCSCYRNDTKVIIVSESEDLLNPSSSINARLSKIKEGRVLGKVYYTWAYNRWKVDLHKLITKFKATQ